MKIGQVEKQGYQIIQGQLGINIELSKEMDPEQMADALELISEFVRENMQGRIKNGIMIKRIKEIRITNIIS